MEYLQKLGYVILEQNFYSRYGEIDIVAKEKEYLVFVEVKYRTSDSNGMPQEAITVAKMRSLTKAARFYLLRHQLGEEIPCRFDVVAILGDKINLICNAFEAMF